jgi:hypothetical protein
MSEPAKSKRIVAPAARVEPPPHRGRGAQAWRTAAGVLQLLLDHGARRDLAPARPGAADGWYAVPQSSVGRENKSSPGRRADPHRRVAGGSAAPRWPALTRAFCHSGHRILVCMENQWERSKEWRRMTVRPRISTGRERSSRGRVPGGQGRGAPGQTLSGPQTLEAVQARRLGAAGAAGSAAGRRRVHTFNTPRTTVQCYLKYQGTRIRR